MQRSFLGRKLLVGVALGAVALLIPGAASAAFPGLNGKIAYTHTVGMSSAAIYTVNPDGSGSTNLSAVGGSGAPTADFQPAWSANGKLIAFVRIDFQHCSGQIWTMRADGTGQTDRSNDGAIVGEINPAFGPDGSIVFVRTPPGHFPICSSTQVNQGDIWILTPSGAAHELTSGGDDNLPAWSPNGQKIAFTRMVPKSGPHIFVVNATGSGTPVDLGPGLKPNWSPDGTKIAFAMPPSNPNGPNGGPVAVMDANGTHRQTLNTNGTAPVWSPDGKQIAYLALSPTSMSTAIAVMNANGSGQHTITTPGSGNSDVKPDWQAVQGTLVFTVSPRSAAAGQTVCFQFRTRSSGKAVAGVRIRLAGRQSTTSTAGRARICVALSAGAHTAVATKPNYHAATTRVAIRPQPAFTG